MTNPMKNCVPALALMLVLTWSAVGISQQSNEQQSNEQQSEQTQRELMVKHAKAVLELAEVELEQALKLNKDGKQHVPRLAVERLRSNLSVAQEQLKQAVIASTGGPEQVRIRHAEEKARLAKLDLDAAEKMVNNGTISKLEFRRLELRHELAELRLALLKQPGTFMTLMDSMDRKLDRFGEEILELDRRVTKLELIRQ